MTNFINTKILLSAAVILAAAAVIVGATFAFFSDTETSEGNVFAAGEIDLRIDNDSYAIDCNIPGLEVCTGALVASTNNSWALTDLTIEKFFNFTDLKPGDYGEDTISVHVGSNDAWVCAAARVTEDLDNSITEPEDNVDAIDDNLDGTPDGDLDSDLNFAFWVDDGDNVLEVNEVPTLFAAGSLESLDTEGQIALSDSTDSGPFGDTPMAGGSTNYIGKGWCFGEMEAAALEQDNEANDGPIDDDDIEGVDRLGTGFTCDGSEIGNISQTDSVEGDLQFYAIQARNNDEFSCDENWTPEWPVEEEVVPSPQP